MLGRVRGLLTQNERLRERLHAAWCVCGIVGCLLLYGVLQERIMAEDYLLPDGRAEQFTASLFLVLCNRMVTCAVTGALLWTSAQPVLPQAPLWNYLAVSGSNVVATFCQYEALKHVSFPFQTLGKCAKMIPVMAWGSLVGGKRYRPRDYFIAGLVTAGCALFVLLGKGISSKAHAAHSSLLGLALMGGYLAADGFTSSWQDRMFRRHRGTCGMSIYNQILYVQACSAAVSVISLIVFGQIAPAIAFVGRHPDCLLNIVTLSGAATVAQLFISHTIKEFGALLFATVMTTRQFLSILLSCFLFLHPLTWGQGGATSLIFGALYYKNLTSGRNAAPNVARGVAKGGEKDKEKELPSIAAELEAVAVHEVHETALERLLAVSNKQNNL